MTGKEFKLLREGLGLSLETVSKSLSVSVSLVYSWENGNRKIRESHVKLFCILYNVNYEPSEKKNTNDVPWLFPDYPEIEGAEK